MCSVATGDNILYGSQGLDSSLSPSNPGADAQGEIVQEGIDDVTGTNAGGLYGGVTEGVSALSTLHAIWNYADEEEDVYSQGYASAK